jgi:protein involved in polysaccharide export with SLBB domain
MYISLKFSRLLLCICVAVFARAAVGQADSAIAADSSIQRAPGGDLSFQPGDALRVSVLPDTGFLNTIFLIDDQGRADFPVIGLVTVTDYTPDELAEKLRAEFIDYMRYPTLIVRPLIRVTALGGFNRPGLYYLEPRANLWHAVRAAGGMIREDGVEKMRWERGDEIISADLVKHFESGQSLQAIGFQSGDRIWLTSRQKRHGWEVFREDVLPMITFTLSTISSAATVYLTVDAIMERNNSN